MTGRFAALERLKDLYGDIAQVPIPVAGRIQKQGAKAKYLQISSIWGNRAPELKKIVKTQRLSLVAAKDSGGMELISTTALPIVGYDSQTIAYTSSDSKMATLITIPDGKEKKQYIRAYDLLEHIELSCGDVSGMKKHGLIHGEGECGCLKWSHGEGHLLYAAERNVKVAQYFDADLEWTNDEKMAEGHVGDKFKLVESWGEQMIDVKRPVLCIMDVPSGNVTVLDDIPEHISPMHARWTPNDDGIVFFGADSRPFKLGKIFCDNRRGSLYYYDLKTADMSKLSDDDVYIEGLSFSTDKKQLLYFKRRAEGPHKSCMELWTVDWATKKSKTVLSIVNEPKDLQAFPGIYWPHVANRSWANDNRRVLFDSVWRSKCEILVVDTDTGKVTRVSNSGAVHGTWNLLDVYDDNVLAVVSAPNRPPAILIGQLPKPGSEPEIVWTRLDTSTVVEQRRSLLNYAWRTLQFRHGDEEQYEGFLSMPKDGDSIPLVVVPHGGPHGISVAGWPLRVIVMLLNCGYAVLSVNYHGSLGFGEKFLRALPGRVGELDVKDIQHAVKTVLDNDARLDRNRVAVLGGSHGGFLASHLVGQFPEMYKVAIALNPVQHLETEFMIGDIPDWAVYEATGQEIDFAQTLSTELRNKMFECSPMAHVDKIKAPFLFLIGEKDLRVAPHYLGFMRNLLSRNVPCKVLTYPESNHGLEEVDVDADYAINVILWLEKYLPQQQHSTTDEATGTSQS